MKLIILAGGFGTRISEETEDKPKPMVLIRDEPILYHLMQIYASQGVNDFVIACGYKKEVIFDWVTTKNFGKWNVNAIDTGLNTQTGGRIKMAMESISDNEAFVAYGDGLGNVNIRNGYELFKSSGAAAVVTAVRPPSRFGVLENEGTLVTHFGEKDHTDVGWINGGFFVLSKNIVNKIQNDQESFEFTTLPKLVEEKLVHSYFHRGFWKPMDTLREKRELEKLAAKNPVPWLEFAD
jgi:glucose-1-phosphate cytidylyltransferase